MSDEIKKKLISFKKEYHEEYLYLQRHGNASRLVCELVRKHMLYEGSTNKKDIKSDIMKQIGYNDTKINESYKDVIIDSAKDLLG